MAKDQVVAIDIGTSTVKILYIEKIGDVLHLINADIMSNPHPESPEQTSDTIKQLWNRIGIKQNIFNKHRMEVGVAIPRGSVVTKRLLNIPPSTTDDQLPVVVEMAAETELPFQPEESIFTFHDIQRSADVLSVELVSTRRETVTRYTEALNTIGTTPSGVIPSMLAIETVARGQLSDSSGRTIIVDIGAGITDFCLMYGDKLQFSRAFHVSGDQLTRTLMTEMDVDAETAEQEKQDIPADQPPTRTWTRRFIVELERSIAAAERELNNEESEEIEEIWLCGGGARVPELAEACQEQLQIPTRLWNPVYAGAIDTSNVASGTLESYGDTLAVPLGVGIHLLDAEQPVSLLPTEVGVKRAESSRKHQQLIAAGIAGFLLLVIALCGITYSRSQQSKLDLLDQQIATFTQLQTDANKQLALELILADKLSHQISPLDVLHAFSTLFKDRTKVAWKTFEVHNLDDLEKTRISCSLQANSIDEINSRHGVLNRAKLFSNIELGEITTTGDERRPTFEVKLTCRLTNEAIQMFAQKRHPKPVIEIVELELKDVNISPPENSESSEKPAENRNEENEEDKENEE